MKDHIRDLVANGRASSVSGFVPHAVRIALHDAAGWNDMLNEDLEQTGGPLTKKERAWADSALCRLDGRAFDEEGKQRERATRIISDDSLQDGRWLWCSVDQSA